MSVLGEKAASVAFALAVALICVTFCAAIIGAAWVGTR